ncbi:MAG: LEPR-XLL domain-containing protein, partial [Betaproteobacteria bacterium]|nr:LEPR-XLL domain-containing protein [Betaproteobacteria bacterium]
MRLETLEPRLLLSADVAGTLDIPGETDRYTFSLDRDTQLYFDALSADPSISWSLSGPRGAEVSGRGFAFSDSAGIGENPVLDLRAGDYTLTVDGLQEATGAYAFRLLDVQAEAVGITPGVVVAGTLDPGNETDAYVFSAAAGDRFYFDAQDVSGSAYWRLLDPYGGVVFGPTPSYWDVDVLTLEASGSYTLLLEGWVYSSTPESYAFNVQPVSDEAAVLAVGAPVSGSIAHAGQVDRYSFTLGAATQLYFDALSADPSISWSLSGPRGAE